MASYPQTPPPPPLGTPQDTTRSRGSSGASMNRYHPDNYLPPTSAPNPQAQGAYFPPYDHNRPAVSNQASYNSNPQPQRPPYAAQNSSPAYLQPYPSQSGPNTPYGNSLTPPANNPPYPTTEPWDSNGHPAPQQQQHYQPPPPPPMNRRRASTSAAQQNGYHGTPRPQSTPRRRPSSPDPDRYRRSSSSAGREHYRRSSSSYGKGHRHSTAGTGDDHEYHPKSSHRHHHHHHHHDDDDYDLKRYDTHRPTLGDTVYSMFGVVKDYFGPVHRD